MLVSEFVEARFWDCNESWMDRSGSCSQRRNLWKPDFGIATRQAWLGTRRPDRRRNLWKPDFGIATDGRSTFVGERTARRNLWKPDFGIATTYFSINCLNACTASEFVEARFWDCNTLVGSYCYGSIKSRNLWKPDFGIATCVSSVAQCCR